MSKITINDLPFKDQNYLEVLDHNSLDLLSICGGSTSPTVFNSLYAAVKALALKLGVEVEQFL